MKLLDGTVQVSTEQPYTTPQRKNMLYKMLDSLNIHYMIRESKRGERVITCLTEDERDISEVVKTWQSIDIADLSDMSLSHLLHLRENDIISSEQIKEILQPIDAGG